MRRFITQHAQRWLTGMLAVWLFLPAAAGAQDLKPFQTIFHNAGIIYIYPARVRQSMSNFLTYRYRPSAFANLNQWTNGNAQDLLYPIDEWGAAQMNQAWIAGGIEEFLVPGATTPTVDRIYSGNERTGTVGDVVAWYKAVRWRPPVILVGRDQIPIGAAGQYYVDPLLPSNQAIFGIDQKTSGRMNDGVSRTNNMYLLENMNLDRCIFEYEKVDHSAVWTRIAGSKGDSVIMTPPGQIWRMWNGWRWMPENARSVLMWGQSSQEDPWQQKKQDDYAGTIVHASRYLTAADAARAARLEMVYHKDGYSDDLNDWDGSRFDDVGNPYIGPQFCGGDVTRETGELLGETITGLGYIDFARGDGDHSTDWVNLSDPSDHAPTKIIVDTRVRNGSAPGNPYFGGATGWWNSMRQPSIQRGDYRLDHFAGLGADVSGIEWRGITAAMVESMPPTTAQGKNDGHLHLWWLAGPIVLDPGETHDRMRLTVVADLPRKESIAIGQRYLKWLAQQKPGWHPNGDALPASVAPLSDLEKFLVCEAIKDTTFTLYDRGFTAFHGGTGSGLTRAQKLAGEGLRRYPDPPPPVDILVSDAAGKVDVYAWYPDETMFNDNDTGVDDFRGWRIYRKRGEPWVNTISEIASFGYRDWEMIAEIRQEGVFNAAGQAIPGVALSADHYNRDLTFNSGETRRVMYYADVNVVRGEPYYYAVSGFDNGSQNTLGFHPGEALEGSRYQSSTAIGGVGIQVTAYSPGVTRTSELTLTGNNVIEGLGATQFALSQSALFDLNVGKGITRAVPVTIAATSTADNINIDNLVSDIQAAINTAIGADKVVVGNTVIGKAAVTEAVEYKLTFAAVEQNVVLGISGVNAVTRDQLGINGGQIGRFVVVSPNPWSPDLGAGLAGDYKQIFFDNLPPLCTLKIFTETGDLVTTIQHTDGSAQETWFQVNENSQLVKSGLYILAVVNANDLDPITGAASDKLPDQFVKFVIIR